MQLTSEVPVEQVLGKLKSEPAAQIIAYKPGQSLFYEGHHAPGVFIFLSGKVKMSSELFQEVRMFEVVDDKATHPRPQQKNSTHSKFFIFPDMKQMFITSPYTATIIEPSEVLFIPRSIVFRPEMTKCLQAIARFQDKRKVLRK